MAGRDSSYSSAMPIKDYQCFRVDVRDKIAHVVMSRPEKRNSMTPQFWIELPEIVKTIDGESLARVIVLSSEGPHFTGGLDLAMFADVQGPSDHPKAHLQKPAAFMEIVSRLQQAISSLEACRLPVLAAIQGGCIGGGVDLVTACDIRYATKDAFLTIHETNIGMTADVGTFPRLLNLIPEGFVRELAYTGRRMPADEAKSIGLVNAVFDTQEAMLERVMGVAAEIASKAPMAVYGCKKVITHARDHSTADGLEFVGIWNASMLHVEEVMEAMSANAQKRPGNFVDLPPRKPVVS